MRQHTQHIALTGLLNFYDVSTKVAEHHSGGGSGNYGGAVNDLKARKNRFHGAQDSATAHCFGCGIRQQHTAAPTRQVLIKMVILSGMNSAITVSLEGLVESLGDPQPQIYQRMFAQYPNTESLFILDTDGGVRGSMLQTTIEAILDYAANNRLDKVSLAAWRSHHLAYDVDAETFTSFFAIIRDCAKEALGADWDQAMDQAWQNLLQQVEATKAS